MMVIKKLTTNWHIDPNSEEACDTYEVGKEGVVSITTYIPYGVEHYDVLYVTGNMKQVSNPNTVDFEKED